MFVSNSTQPIIILGWVLFIRLDDPEYKATFMVVCIICNHIRIIHSVHIIHFIIPGALQQSENFYLHGRSQVTQSCSYQPLMRSVLIYFSRNSGNKQEIPSSLTFHGKLEAAVPAATNLKLKTVTYTEWNIPGGQKELAKFKIRAGFLIHPVSQCRNKSSMMNL